MASTSRTTKSLLLLFLFCVGCQSAPAHELPEDASGAPAAIDRLLEAEALGISNASLPEQGLLCSAQLSETQFELLSKSGYQTFINLRAPGERGTGWEALRAEELGVVYVSIPIADADGINESNARRLADALDGSRRPAVLYCGSSNRVGALYGLRAFYTQDKSPEESLALGELAGATRLMPRLMEALGLAEQ